MEQIESPDTDDYASPNWWLTSVYGPQDDGEKLLFLEELEAVRDACTGHWMIIGDFNLILDEADKNNARINRLNMRNFRHTVAALELQDLHLHGRTYTWSNERDSPTLVNLHTNASFPPKPRFHFEIFWPKLEGYEEAVRAGWQCTEDVRDPWVL